MNPPRSRRSDCYFIIRWNPFQNLKRAKIPSAVIITLRKTVRIWWLAPQDPAPGGPLLRILLSTNTAFLRVLLCVLTSTGFSCHYFYIYFFKVFGGHISFLGPLVTSGDISSGIQSQSEFCLICFFAEANVMHIPQDPPLVLHMPTSWWLACSWSLPDMHVHRLDLAQIRTGNHLDRRWTATPYIRAVNYTLLKRPSGWVATPHIWLLNAKVFDFSLKNVISVQWPSLIYGYNIILSAHCRLSWLMVQDTV